MKRFRMPFAALALSLALMSSAPMSPVTAVTQHSTVESASGKADEWWKHAVIYEIYPRSFADARNAGMGNIQGITSKLDYLKELGVDAIWITPCYPSPQVDFGYDISDYEQIAPEYGTLADFDKLIAEANKRNIKIIMDLVLNHTSDKHPWFVESASSKSNPKRDWYIWRDGKADGSPPNNWQSLFGHSAWKLDPKTNQYYYHFFYAEQPDLNWRNPEVRKAMYDTARFWLDRGVAGFRLDAVDTLFEDPKLTDNPVSPGKNKYGDLNMDDKNNKRLPEIHDVLKELRAVLDTYPGHRVLVGETFTDDYSGLAEMYGKNHDEIQLPMNFFFADINKLSAPDFRTRIAEADINPKKGWPVYLFSNHDQVRHYDRYGNGGDNDAIAKLTATMLLTLRGTPLLYYGEEIGMANNDPKRVEDVKDPIGKIGWPQEKGRDGERTPMQWTAGKNGGFSDAETWLPVGGNVVTHNVAAEKKDPNSILNFYKTLIHLRRTDDALINGKYVALNEQDKNVLSYLRQGDKDSVIVALNMSNAPQEINVDLSKTALTDRRATTLLSSGAHQQPNVDLHKLQLAPYAVYVGRIR